VAHEFDGKKHAKASAHQQEWSKRLVEELALRGSERVLDLGFSGSTSAVKGATTI
jgi:hypothetical protein